MQCTGDVDAGSFVTLPLVAGNVRNDSMVGIYREFDTFRTIRQTSRLKGRCSRCEFKEICGGSRARAYAATGEPQETDPLCAYEPGTYKMERYGENG